MTSLQSQIDAIPWFHHFDKETFGFETKGIKGIPNRREVDLWGFKPEMFKDKTVLDIGAWDGYFSFYAEAMGASRVLATDHFCWGGAGWGTKAGFDFAHQLLKSKVETLEIDLREAWEASRAEGRNEAVMSGGGASSLVIAA